MVNPNQIKVVKKKQIFVVEDCQTVTSDKQDGKGWAPMEIHHANFSRFVFTVISEQKKALSANFPVSQLPGMKAATQYAFRRHMDYIYSGQNAQKPENNPELSAGYTVRISSGQLKGKTPVEVMLAEGDRGADLLNKQYQWLKSNLGKYPKNKEQMDAILDAASLVKQGKLDSSLVASAGADAPVIRLYVSGPRPLLRKKTEDGMFPVYELEVIWKTGNDFPVEVSIKTYHAPVKIQGQEEAGAQQDASQMKFGQVKVQISKARDMEQNRIRLSVDDWLSVLDTMESRMRLFESMEGPALYRKARAMQFHAAQDSCQPKKK